MSMPRNLQIRGEIHLFGLFMDQFWIIFDAKSGHLGASKNFG